MSELGLVTTALERTPAGGMCVDGMPAGGMGHLLVGWKVYQ